MSYDGPERRKYIRINGRFIVSYRILEESDNTDISQTKNVSLGGMIFTSNRGFAKGTKLCVKIRLPADPTPIELSGEVVESREIVKGVIYDTRLKFLAINDSQVQVINRTAELLSKRETP